MDTKMYSCMISKDSCTYILRYIGTYQIICDFTALKAWRRCFHLLAMGSNKHQLLQLWPISDVIRMCLGCSMIVWRSHTLRTWKLLGRPLPVVGYSWNFYWIFISWNLIKWKGVRCNLAPEIFLHMKIGHHHKTDQYPVLGWHADDTIQICFIRHFPGLQRSSKTKVSNKTSGDGRQYYYSPKCQILSK